MPWTAPKTWNVGELVTAGLLNTHLRDNLASLKTRPGTWTAIFSDFATTSQTFVDVPGLAISFTAPGAADYLFLCCATLYRSSGAGPNFAKMRFVVNSTNLHLVQQELGGGAQSVNMMYRFTVPAGACNANVQIHQSLAGNNVVVAGSLAWAFIMAIEVS